MGQEQTGSGPDLGRTTLKVNVNWVGPPGRWAYQVWAMDRGEREWPENWDEDAGKYGNIETESEGKSLM